MIKKLFRKKILVSVSAAAILCSLMGTCDIVAYASENSRSVSADAEGIVPHSDIIEYRYMVVDGDLYRRLYNYTQEHWIGEWELIVEGNH